MTAYGPLECLVLGVLERGPATKAEVCAALPDRNAKSIGTCLSVLRSRGVLYAKVVSRGYGNGRYCVYALVAQYAQRQAA